MRSKYFFLLINILLFANVGGAQTVRQSISRADSLLNAGAYDDALKTYKRALYFTDTSFEIKKHIYSRLGQCYFYKNDHQIAAEQFTYALLYSNSQLEKNKLRLQKAKALIMAKNFDDARIELNKTDTLNYPALAREVHFYKATLNFVEADFTSAENEFIYLAGNDELKRKQVKIIFIQNKKNNRKSSVLAGAMSVVIPGAGQAYAGEIETGINSLLLTSALLVLGYNTAIVYGIEHALIAVAPWYTRYYTYGVQHAAQLTLQKKLAKREQFLQQLLKLSAVE